MPAPAAKPRSRAARSRARVLARLRREDGVALPAAIAVLLILLMLTGGTVTYALRSVERSTYDRQTTRALAAADAGLEVAAYRMGQIATVRNADDTLQLNLSVNALIDRTLGLLRCSNIAVADLLQLGINRWCALGSWEQVENLGPGQGSRFTYYTRLRLELLPNGNPLPVVVVEDVVAVGESSGRQVRVMRPYEAPDPLGLPLTLEAKSFVQCPSTGWTESQPDAGCPS